MTAKEIFEDLKNSATEVWTETCDLLSVGDENKTVKKAGTCFKLTAEVADMAIAAGVDMLITHEPVFSGICKTPTELEKYNRLNDAGVVVYRFHDHAHLTEPDYIHEGFIRDTGLKIAKRYPRECLGVSRYELEEPIKLTDLAENIGETLNLEYMRLVGKKDITVKTVILGLGAVGFDQFEYLNEPGGDLFITGCAEEVCDCEYVRDMAYYGAEKAVLFLGHYGAEFAGMRYLAEKMSEKYLPTEYFDCGEVLKLL